MAQFRDNILVATSLTQDKNQVMGVVTRALSQAWNLLVLCTYDDTCVGGCLQRSINVVGVSITLITPGKSPLVSLHPSTLDASWNLKWVAPLQSPEHCSHRYIFDLFVRVLQSNLNLVRTWAGLLLLVAAWLQVAVLSGFQKSKLVGPMCEAITRACARTSDDAEPSKKWVGFIVRHLPSDREAVSNRLYFWLRRHGFWAGGEYASWHAPHRKLEHSMVCGTWYNDSEGLRSPP